MHIKLKKGEMGFTFWLILIAAGLFTYQPVYAGQTLTLEECIALALKNNDSLNASLSDLELHRQKTKISHSELFPKLKSNLQYSIFDRAPSFIIEKNAFAPGVPMSNAELPAGERNNYAFTLSVEQSLFTGGYLTSRYMRNIMQEKASEMNTKNTENETILKVKLAYYDILKAFKLKEIQQQSLKLKEERKRVAKEQHKGGLIKKEELLLIESDLSKQKLEFRFLLSSFSMQGFGMEPTAYTSHQKGLPLRWWRAWPFTTGM